MNHIEGRGASAGRSQAAGKVASPDFKRDRFGHNHAMTGQQFVSRMIYMAHAKGYVMCRRPRCRPFVLTEKQWLEFPLWDRTSTEN